jgi:hypothetical protein
VPSASSAPAKPAKPAKPALWRRIVVPLCVVLGCVLVSLSVVATWIKLTALDTDTYVDTVSPLVEDPAVSTAISTGVVQRVFDRVDVDSVVQQVLPGRAQALSEPLVNVLQRYAQQVVDGFVTSEQFRTIWTEANRTAHTQAVRLLKGEVVSSETKEKAQDVVLNLQGVVTKLNSAFEKLGLDLRIPAASETQTGQFVIATKSQLDTARQYVDLLNTVAYVLPIIALVLFAVAILLSPRRARVIMWIGLGTIITLAVLAIVLRIVRRHFIGSIKDPTRQAAADSIWAGVFHGLRVQVVVAIVLALLVALAGWFLGGSRGAVAGRQGIRTMLGRWRGEASANPGAVSRFVARFRRPIQLLSVAVAILVLLAAPKVTLGLVLLAALIVIVVLLLVEFIAGPPSASAPAEPPG